MFTGYSIFGGPVETMDGQVRGVSIMPKYVLPQGFGAEVPTAVTPPGHPRQPARYGSGMTVTRIHKQLGPHGMMPPHTRPGTLPGGVPGAGGFRPAPGGHPHLGPHGSGLRPAPPGTFTGRPGQSYQPHQTLPRPVPPGNGGGSGLGPWGGGGGYGPPGGNGRPQGPPPLPCPVPMPCDCSPPMPMGPIMHYNPTPSYPVAPMQQCPLPQIDPMQMCGQPIAGSSGAHLYHPGGTYPITQTGPGVNDGLTHSPVLNGQLPVGAGTDIFGATVIAEDATMSRRIGGNGCGPGMPPVPGGCGAGQPQYAYNWGGGVFANHGGVFGASPDGLGAYDPRAQAMAWQAEAAVMHAAGRRGYAPPLPAGGRAHQVGPTHHYGGSAKRY